MADKIKQQAKNPEKKENLYVCLNRAKKLLLTFFRTEGCEEKKSLNVDFSLCTILSVCVGKKVFPKDYFFRGEENMCQLGMD